MRPARIRSAASQLRGAKVKANVRRGDVLADSLIAQVRGNGLVGLKEHRFHPTRKWRFDVLFLATVRDVDGVGYFTTKQAPVAAVEIEGGAWVAGAHSRGAHFRSDCEKYAEAACLGFVVLRVMPEHITNGKAAEWLRRISETHHAQG